MKLTGTFSASAIIALALAAVTAQAHHSSAQFSLAPQDIREITGTVEKFQWSNPHAWIWLIVQRSDGQTERWGFEMASPGSLRQSNLNWDSIKTGEKLTITYGPSRDGAHVGVLAGKFVHEDGRVWIGQGTASPVQGRYNPDGSLRTPSQTPAATNR